MTNIEPVIRKSAAAGSIPLNTAGPLNKKGADLIKGRDLSHFTFRDYRIFEVPAGSTVAQAAYKIFEGVVANTLVLEVNTLVMTAFTTSVTLTIGDGTALFLHSAGIAPQTKGTIARSQAAAQALTLGKWYETGGDVVLTVGGANALAGKLLVEIVYQELHRFSSQAIA